MAIRVPFYCSKELCQECSTIGELQAISHVLYQRFSFGNRLRSVWNSLSARQRLSGPALVRLSVPSLLGHNKVDMEYLHIIITCLEDMARNGELGSIRFKAFKDFKKRDWKDFAVIVNAVVIGRFVNVERDPHGKVARGTTGMCTIAAHLAPYSASEHDEELLGWLTYKRAYQHTIGEYEEPFSDRTLDILCIAINWDGLFGMEHGIRPGDFPHHF
jgi:hypothetical protein